MWSLFGKQSDEDAEWRGPHRVHVDQPVAREVFRRQAAVFLRHLYTPTRRLAVLCIGTDRSTGDCLGPLIGTKLSTSLAANVMVLGTLDRPVHAVNLVEAMDNLRSWAPDPFVIAIDACLGRTESVGYISLKEGPLQPGTGVNKNLPSVGDFHIIGIVNVGGFMEYLVLQNTRLSLVMRMAEIIAEGLRDVIAEILTPDAEVIDPVLASVEAAAGQPAN
ncbi:MAG: spore protease YyaC [Bacteroidota bacterium]